MLFLLAEFITALMKRLYFEDGFTLFWKFCEKTLSACIVFFSDSAAIASRLSRSAIFFFYRCVSATAALSAYCFSNVTLELNEDFMLFFCCISDCFDCLPYSAIA